MKIFVMLLILFTLTIAAGDYKKLNENTSIQVLEYEGTTYIRVLNLTEYNLNCKIYLTEYKNKIKYQFKVRPYKNGPWYVEPNNDYNWSCR